MPRKPRIHYPGTFYHVILKGNAGNSFFFEDMDRSKFFLDYYTGDLEARILGDERFSFADPVCRQLQNLSCHIYSEIASISLLIPSLILTSANLISTSSAILRLLAKCIVPKGEL